MSMVCVVYLLVDGRNSVSKFRESGFHLSYKRERQERIIRPGKKKILASQAHPHQFLAAGSFLYLSGCGN